MARSLLLAATLALAAASAQALCTSDGVAQPRVLLERFINADCEACWRDPDTPRPPAGALVLDWVLPGAQGEDAPLASVAVADALDRLAALGQAAPPRAASYGARRQGRAVPLRIAQGDAFNDYIGTSLELKAPGRERWQAWLLLVEQLPPGIEGSPVARNLVRNVFRPDWPRQTGRAPAALEEQRAMRIQEGSRPERLRLVALLQDGRGVMRAITQTGCSE